ncbi:outer membrane lipoprotein carrier protein LolA [uncultured Fibrobacter sp.]|uniref:LolA family protein n=1 Tax=uncultured Fibrobacter sp. TaxID=261512 RepID=UPI0025DB7464|nr:outer membrane lipoprotein carrier protein LolA [uncultured Fibrobacter sp.]
MLSPMKFATILFCACALLATNGFSAEGEIWKHPVKDSESTAIDSTFAPMTAHKVVRGDFKQTKFIAQLNREFVSVGKFTIANGNGLLWDTEKPFASQLAITESGMVQQNANGTRSEVSAKDNVVFAQIAKTIQSVFSGSTAKLQAGFHVFFDRHGKNWTVGLVPRESSVKKTIQSIELSGSAWLERIKLVDGSGSPLLYELSNPKPSSELTAKEKALLEK